METREIDRRHDQEPFVVQELAQSPESIERVDYVFEDVQHDDRVRACRRLVQLFQRLLLEVDVKSLASDLDRPFRGLDAPSPPAVRPRRIEEETDIRADLEEAISPHEEPAHSAKDPGEQFPSSLLFVEVVLVDDLCVAIEDLLRCELGL